MSLKTEAKRFYKTATPYDQLISGKVRIRMGRGVTPRERAQQVIVGLALAIGAYNGLSYVRDVVAGDDSVSGETSGAVTSGPIVTYSSSPQDRDFGAAAGSQVEGSELKRDVQSSEASRGEYKFPEAKDAQFDENGITLRLPLHARAMWQFAREAADIKDTSGQLLFNIDPVTLFGFAFRESALNVYGISGSGAMGITQFMPGTLTDVVNRISTYGNLAKYRQAAQDHEIDLSNIYSPRTAFFLAGAYMSGDVFPGEVGMGGSQLPKGEVPEPGSSEYASYMKALVAAIGSYHDGPSRIKINGSWSSIVTDRYAPIVQGWIDAQNSNDPNPDVIRQLFREMYGGLKNGSSVMRHSTYYSVQTMIGVLDVFGLEATEVAYGVDLKSANVHDAVRSSADMTLLVNALVDEFERNGIFDSGEIDKAQLEPHIDAFVAEMQKSQ